MKRILLAATIILSIAVQAQEKDTTWKKGGDAGLNFSQSSFTNWAAGGENALSLTAFTNVLQTIKKVKTHGTTP